MRTPFRVASLVGLVVVLLLGLVPPAAAQVVFGPPIISQPDAPAFYSGALGDLNGDGHLDLSRSLFMPGPQVDAHVYFGDGRGHFGPALATTPQISSTMIGLGDLDGDGRPELLTVAYDDAPPLELQVWSGQGGNAFGGPTSYPIAGFNATDGRITVADFDGDADLDVLVWIGNSEVFVFEIDALTLLLNDGVGGLAPQAIASDTFIPFADAGDLDGDGLADVVYTSFALRFSSVSELRTHILLGQPGGSLIEAHTLTDLWAFAVADCDGDGVLDLIFRDGAVGPSLTVHLGQGDATFMAQPTQTFPTSVDPEAVADFDGDGLTDLLARHFTGVIKSTYAVWPGDGRGGFDGSRAAYANREDAMSGSPRLQFVADVLADGRLDIVDGGLSDLEDGNRLSTIPNWTYPAGAPQLDLGQPQFGMNGWPATLVSGRFEPDESVTMQLWEAGDDLPAFLVAGLTESLLPFKGGVLVPEPDALFGPISTGSAPILELEGRWPAGLPVDASITLQWWIADPVAPQGMSASSAVRITQP